MNKEKYKVKKSLSIALAAVMIFSTMSVTAFAGETPMPEEKLQLDMEALLDEGYQPAMNQKLMNQMFPEAEIKGAVPSAFSVETNAKAVVDITTIEDLNKIKENPTGNFLLKNNLDMAGAYWMPIPTFGGILDGGTFTISNFKVKDGVGGFFNQIIGGQVKNLNFTNVDIEDRSDKNVGMSGACVLGNLFDGASAENCTISNAKIYGGQCTAVLSGIASGAVVKNCTVENSIVYPTYSGQFGDLQHPFCVGGLVGEAFQDSQISGCTVKNTNIEASTEKIGLTNYAWQIGGLVGEALVADIDNCKVEGGKVSGYYNVGGFIGSVKNGRVGNSSTSAEVEGNSNTGGFVGYIGGDSARDEITVVSNCSATGTVNGDNCVGGFVGVSTFVNMINSYATGDVTAKGYEGGSLSYAGGFVGRTTGSSRMIECYATGDATGRKGVGGFAGLNMTGNARNPMSDSYIAVELGGKERLTSKISDCYATGNVKTTDNFGSSAVGGFVGVNGTNIPFPVNCYATGDVTGFKNVGGFAGTIDGAGAINCYASGKVTAFLEDTVGGFVGLVSRSSYGEVKFVNCFFDKDGTKAVDAIGSIDESIKETKSGSSVWKPVNPPIDNIVGLSASEVQTKEAFAQKNETYEHGYKSMNGDGTFIEVSYNMPWNFEKVWAIDENKTTPYLRQLGNGQGIRLTTDMSSFEKDGTVVVNMSHMNASKQDDITWNVLGANVIERTHDMIKLSAEKDAKITVEVFVNGLKAKKKSFNTGDYDEKGIYAIFITPAPPTDSLSQTAYNVDKNKELIVKFTDSVDVAAFEKITNGVTVKNAKMNKGVAIKTTFTDGNKTLKIKPNVPLLNGVEYIVTLSDQLKSTAGLRLKGVSAMNFFTRNFDAPKVQMTQNGATVKSLKAGETYHIQAAFVNEMPCYSESDSVVDQSKVFVVVRSGLGARGTYGGDILLSRELPLSVATGEKSTVDTELFIPNGIEGTVFVDVYTWDEEKAFAKAVPVHAAYKVAK